nr:ascorbate peroxidase isozyme II, AP-II [spinach, leaves, Peptide Partial, 16 aa] [Spinacia oleracea]
GSYPTVHENYQKSIEK